MLAHKTNQNGLKRAVSLGPVLPERSHGRLDHRTSTVWEERQQGTRTSGTLPGPDELEALGHVESSEAHGHLSTASCATPGLTPGPCPGRGPGPRPGPEPGPATTHCMAGQQVPLEREHRAERALGGWLTWGQEEDPGKKPVPTTSCPRVLSTGTSQALLSLSARSPQDPAPAPSLSPTTTISPDAGLTGPAVSRSPGDAVWLQSLFAAVSLGAI